MKTALYKLGYEIEGEFSQPLIKELKKWGEIKSDGSLSRCSSSKHLLSRVESLAEYASPPLHHKDDMAEIRSFFTLLDKAYQNKEFHFNNTCGFHIHLSFTPSKPPELFSTQFMEYFRELLKEKQKLVVKRRAANRFCRIVIAESELIQEETRYRFVNILPAYNKHGTIEFRIFPANKPQIMYRYLIFTLGAVRQFLRRQHHLAFEAEIDDTTEPLTENYSSTSSLQVLSNNFSN